MLLWRWGGYAGLVLATAGTATAQDVDSGSLAPARDAAPAEAWWTGPISASSAETLPRGHVLFEPYLFDVRSAGSDYIGSLTYVLYGVTDRLTLGVIPTFGSARVRGSARGRRIGVGDLTLSAQYRLNRAAPGALVPTVSLVVQRTLPLGRFDRLDGDPELGIGAGARSTLVGVYAQRVDRLGNGRPLRTRLNVTYSFAPRVGVDGESVYGTADGFRGSARPGATALVDLSVEYSVTRNWVLATDLVYRTTGETSMHGEGSGPDSILPAARAISIAPAVEYSWSASRGVLVGVRLAPKGQNAAASVTPVIAFNAVF